MRRSTRQLSARRAATLALVLACSRAAPAVAKLDPLGNAPGKTKAELVVPAADADLSATRVDCDVFGWNDDYSEVAAVGAELWRGPRGKHRGHVFLLVYELGQMVPLHNINVHVLTHVDLPHDPVPLDDARDLMTNIEGPFLEMWPRGPHRRRPPRAMAVTPLWYPVAKGAGLCTPAIGFALHWRGEKRVQPFAEVDMQVRCETLTETDARTYWGKNDVAATMMRWDFSARRDNERSARFVASAAWHLARPLRVAIAQSMPLDAATDLHLHRTLRPLGTVHLRSELLRRTPEGDAGIQEVAVRGGLEALGGYLAHTLHVAAVVPLPASSHDDVVVRVGPPESRRASGPPLDDGAAAARPRPLGTDGTSDGTSDGAPDSTPGGSASATGGAAPDASAGATHGAPPHSGGEPDAGATGPGTGGAPSEGPTGTPPPPRPRYLDDWKMP